jgi:type IV pilus assembly protein PilB
MSTIVEKQLQDKQLAPPKVPEEVSSPKAIQTLRGPLGQRLLSADLIDAGELEAALSHQVEKGQKLGEALLELGFANEEQLLPFMESQLGIVGVRLREGLLDPVAVKLIPRPLAEKLNALALFRVRDTLVVATEDPQDLDMIDQIEHLTGLTVRPVFAFSVSIQRMQRRAYEEDFRVDAVTADLDESAVELQVEASDVDIASVHDLVDGSPVINLVNYLVLQAIRKMASDIHIEPSRKFGTVRFRIDGQLVEMLRPRRDIFPAIVSRIKVMARLDIAEQRVPQDGRCQVVADGKEVDLRVSTLPTVLGEKVVIRVLDKQRLTFNLDELGVPPDTLGTLKGLLKKPYGLVLVTGPTGSGKTTTLYSALELIKSVNRNIVTVEDPVEYQIELVNQVQADPTRGVSFASALRSILRQDPDVIMVGEIRDAETAQVAVQAALTGHLVLSTLHTNDSVSAITRMMDMGIESYKLAAALIGVVAQRLVRTICPNCQTTYYPRSEFLKALHYKGDMRRSFAKGEGCRECFDSGFKGRTGIYEVLPVTADVRRMIADQAPLETVREWFTQQGYSSLIEGGLRLAEQEVSSLEEVARIAFVE